MHRIRGLLMTVRQGTKPRQKVALVLAIAAIVTLTGAESSCKARTSSRASNNSSVSVVVYSVSSNARITSVTFIDDNGKTRTDSSVGRSWSGGGPAEHGRVLVSATTSRDDAWIKCSVEIGDKVIQKSSAQGRKGTRVVCDVTY
jgi:hypothetical protein